MCKKLNMMKLEPDYDVDPCAAAPKFCRAALPPKFLWLRRIPAENVNFISQPNIFRRNFGAHRNPINCYIPNNVESVNTAH